MGNWGKRFVAGEILFFILFIDVTAKIERPFILIGRS